MALYPDVRKIAEDDRVVQHSYSDIQGTTETLTLDKVEERLSPTSGQHTDYLYWEVAARIAAAWNRDHAAPDRLLVQA